VRFTDEEKILLFDKIEQLYFHRNFGSTSKSDFETLLFSEYVNCCARHGVPYDDYSLSKQLGITQSRIRSLMERKELKYPTNSDDNWWRYELVKAVKNAKYDGQDHYVKFIIQDVNVMNEIRHYIESIGWYDEISLNRKLIRIPLDCFAEICLQDETLSELFSRESREHILTLYKKNASDDSAIKDFINDFSKDGLKAFLMSASKEAIGLVLQALPFGGLAKAGFGAIQSIISKM